MYIIEGRSSNLKLKANSNMLGCSKIFKVTFDDVEKKMKLMELKIP